MAISKQIIAGLALLLSTAGLLLSLAGGVGVWFVIGPATAKATRIFARIDAALDLADRSLDLVKSSLARASERLQGVREEQRKLAQEPRKTNPLGRILAQTVRQRIAPDFSDAHEKLHTVAEAVVVVNSVLEDVGNVPFLTVAGLDMGRLTEINGRLAEVGPAVWDLSRLLGDPGVETDAETAGTQLSRVERALQAIRGLIAEHEPQVTLLRERTEGLQARTLPWITPVAVLVSISCFWIALSQLSVLCHAWAWWKS
jgi:hypothetical protein